MKEKILITSALPYANGPLHFGHIAGAYLPGDCYARFERLLGNDVLYLCGSDEYGIAITLSAEKAGRTPKEHVDIFHQVNLDLFKKMSFSFDHYSRTTSPYHQAIVQEFFLDLLKNGFIEKRKTEQLYSENEKRFLADRYVVGTCPKCGFENARGDECTSCGGSFEATDLKNPRSSLSGDSLVLKETEHWFLLLDKMKDKILSWLETKKNWKPNVFSFVKNYIDDLRPRSITRDSNWGIPVPLDNAEGKVLYVWFDAPIGYITAAVEWAEKSGDKEAWKRYWMDDKTKLVQFIGKDNIPFHAAIFPAMIMGQNKPYKLVDELPANEFYQLEGKQFSKSEGWYIDLESFFERYTSDQIRFAIAASAPEAQDSAFTWKEFQMHSNSELLGKYGNFVHRVVTFAHRYLEGKIPTQSDLNESDRRFLQNLLQKTEEIKEAYATFRLRKATSLIMEMAQLSNAYFDQNAPWKLAKKEDADSKAQLQNVIRLSLEAAKMLAIVASPIIPDTAQKIWHLLGFGSKTMAWDLALAANLQPGVSLGVPEILFRKIEDEEIQKEIDKLHHLEKKKMVKEGKPEVTFDDFQKLDFRVGEILQADLVPKSKKLLRLQVDIGGELRQVIAGIGEKVRPEELLNKKVAILINLKPAKIMGLESQGMLLAASDEHHLEPLLLNLVEKGSSIK